MFTGRRLRKKFKKEFEKTCLHIKPCQACPHWSFRGKYRDKCVLEERLKEKYKIKEESS